MRLTGYARLGVVAAVLVFACRDARVPVERVEVAGSAGRALVAAGLTADEASQMVEARLAGHRGFVMAREGAHVRLDVEFLEVSGQADGAQVREVRAAANLTLTPAKEGSPAQVFSVGSWPLSGDGKPGRRAFAGALERALEGAVADAHVELAALSKSERVLVEELRATDPRIRRAAAERLARRGRTDAVVVLARGLESDDPLEVRRTLGLLVELRRKEAVPAIIEVVRARDHQFVREIVYALGEIGGDEAEAFLDTVAQGHDQPSVRQAAEQALKELVARRQRGRKEER